MVLPDSAGPLLKQNLGMNMLAQAKAQYNKTNNPDVFAPEEHVPRGGFRDDARDGH